MKILFDVIVIGAGHAGLEAATSASRGGVSVALITIDESNIGEMSCNPAIGGLGKGHIVREIDALDGVMGRLADMAGIQFKMLNASKGPAVRGPRSQIDRKLYKQACKQIIEEYKAQYDFNLIFAQVEDIVVDNNVVQGVVLSDGTILKAKSVVLTTGTFLNGIIHMGDTNYPGGRYGDKPSLGLSNFLKHHNFEVGRLKTGTPARLDLTTIDTSILDIQKADDIPTPFSFLNSTINVPQIECFITHTNEETHKIIKDNITLSAMYSGNISGIGPRYCPSIEDKVVRFADKSSHQIFLEPEGLDDITVYPNGISTSLPQQVQDKFIRSMNGLQNVKIIRYGYAIEYDYVNPQELKNTLQTHKIAGLFLAGQINGTTGYEEAGGQGLIAGINACLYAKDSTQEFVINRDEGYIGVMIDDLITNGVSEPYRMFTSRAEYRILLRSDNADQRLTQKAIDFGFCSQNRKQAFEEKMNKLNTIKLEMQKLSVSPSKMLECGVAINQDGIKRNALQLLSFSNISLDDIYKIWQELKSYDASLMNLIDSDCKYDFYAKKQLQDIEIYKKEENLVLPNNLDYSKIDGLSAELVEKFNKIKPQTLAMCMRIRGATPSCALAILTYLKKNEKSLIKNA